ncbi:MAG: 1,2-phenylacetyl-CoA epoxidase subunit PaaD [Pseudomonadota bacterium]
MNDAALLPSTKEVWHWLTEVPDPEIPVISIVDLGIVRHVAWDGDTLVVDVTPTYSGCPAASVINLDIEKHLRGRGIEKLRLERRLSPAWTTDWITNAGREKLRAYGIAPPVDGTSACGSHSATRARLDVACPRCSSTASEKISEFGSTPCKASYRCTVCLEPFDYFKCI